MLDVNTIIHNCMAYSQVYIYGDGEVGRLMRILLHEQGIEITGFLTTKEPRHTILMGVPVKKIETFDFNKGDSYLLICMHNKWWSESEVMLRNLGIINYVIINDDIRKEAEARVQFKDLYDDVEHNINVLLYHRVESLDTVYSIIVEKQNFEDQLKYINANFQVIRCDEDWSNIDGKRVALTFDDGYVDFFHNTYPLLKKYNIPATVFVSTGGIDNDKEFWWDELENILNQPILPNKLNLGGKYVNVQEYPNRSKLIMGIRNEIIGYSYIIRDDVINDLKKQIAPNLINRYRYRTMNSEELSTISKDPLITIGAHTIHHILCDVETDEVQKYEIKSSKDKLEEIVDKEINLFAYPTNPLIFQGALY